MSPLTYETPGAKRFVEMYTGEQLIVSTQGIYAGKKGEDSYL